MAFEEGKGWKQQAENAAADAVGARAMWEVPDLSLLSPSMPAPELPLSPFGGWADWIKSTAEAASAPADYTAFALITTAASLVGNSRCAEPDPNRTDWIEPLNFWTALIGPPSSGKTPSLSIFDQFLREIEDTARRAAEPLIRGRQEKLAVAKQAEKAWEKRVKAAFEEDPHAEPPPKPDNAKAPPPIAVRRCRVSDATIEKLAQLLKDAPKGLLQWRDELAAWIEGMERYSSASDRPHWLEMYSGGSVTLERVKHEEPVHVPRALVSILGGIQPGVLDRLLVQSPNDGLLARFLLIAPDIPPLKRSETCPDHGRLRAAFQRLDRLDFDHDESGEAMPVHMAFHSDAAHHFFDFRAEVRGLANGTDGVLGGWIGKAPGHVARLAAVLALLDWSGHGEGPAPRDVSSYHVSRACELWSAYLHPMARRVFGGGWPVAERVARRIICKARQDDVRRLNKRDVGRSWSIAEIHATRSVRDEAFDVLEEDGLIRRSETSSGPGRKAGDYEVNPLIFR